MLPHVDKGTVDLPSSCNLGSVKLVQPRVNLPIRSIVRGERRGDF